jgi:hypothetical protein
MFVANFLTGPGTDNVPHNVHITFGEYIHGKWNPHQFLKNLSVKYDTDYLTQYYYVGVKYAKV